MCKDFKELVFNQFVFLCHGDRHSLNLLLLITVLGQSTHYLPFGLEFPRLPCAHLDATILSRYFVLFVSLLLLAFLVFADR